MFKSQVLLCYWPNMPFTPVNMGCYELARSGMNSLLAQLEVYE